MQFSTNKLKRCFVVGHPIAQYSTHGKFFCHGLACYFKESGLANVLPDVIPKCSTVLFLKTRVQTMLDRHRTPGSVLHYWSHTFRKAPAFTPFVQLNRLSCVSDRVPTHFQKTFSISFYTKLKTLLVSFSLFFENFTQGTRCKKHLRTVVSGEEQNLNKQMAEFRIAILFQYFMYLLAKLNTFSRSWKAISQFSTAWEPWINNLSFYSMTANVQHNYF